MLRHLIHAHFKDSCTITCLGKNCDQLTSNDFYSLQTVNIDMPPSNGTLLSKAQKILKTQTRCAIFVHEGDKMDWLLKLRSLIVPIENSAVIYSGTHEPERAFLVELNKPVIWASANKIVN